jgi:hypothetical protein
MAAAAVATTEGLVTAISYDSEDDLESAPLFDFVGSTGLAVGRRRAGRPPAAWRRFDAVCNVGRDEYAGTEVEARHGYYAHLPGDGAAALARAIRFCAAHLARRRKILVHAGEGREDRAAAVAVAVLVACFDATGAFRMALLAALPFLDDAGTRDAVTLRRADASARLAKAFGWLRRARPTSSLAPSDLEALYAFFDRAPPPAPPPPAPALAARRSGGIPKPQPAHRPPRATWEPPNAMSLRAPGADAEQRAASPTFLFCCPGRR